MWKCTLLKKPACGNILDSPPRDLPHTHPSLQTSAMKRLVEVTWGAQEGSQNKKEGLGDMPFPLHTIYP